MLARNLPATIVIGFWLGLAGTAPAQDAAPKDDGVDTPKAKADAATKSKAKGKVESGGKLEKATFGGGCFWCIEAVFERIPGVKSAVSGYSGGEVPKPSYEMVCTGLTGHAEVVQIAFDPEVVSYAKLLEVFFAAHDPTTLNRQGPDFGTQYRSVIFYHSEEQRQAALKMYRELTSAGVFGDPIVTQLVPFRAFYPAEKHHQDYYRRNRSSEYCQMQITPKLKKLHLAK